MKIIPSSICFAVVIFFSLTEAETQAAYTWSKSSPKSGQNIFPSMDIAPDGSKVVLTSWNDGVYISTNGGTAWTKKSPAGSGVLAGWNSAGLSDNGTVIAAVAWNDYLYLSKDSGSTWSKKSPAGSGITKGWNSSSVNGAGTVIVSCAYNDHLYLSADGGTTWGKKSPAGTGITKGWTSTAVNGAGTVIATAAFNDYVYISTDTGATWSKKSPAGSGITKGWKSVAVNGAGTFFVAVAYNDYVYISADSGKTWSQKSPAGAGKGWNSVAVSGSGAQIAVSAENDYIYTSGDSGATWTKNNPSGGTVGLEWQSVAISDVGTKLAAAANGSNVYFASKTSSTGNDFNPSSFKFRLTHFDKTLSNPESCQGCPVVPVESVTFKAVFEAGADSPFPTIGDDSEFSISLGGWQSGVLTLSQAIRKRLGAPEGYAKFAIGKTTDGSISKETIILKWTSNSTITVILSVKSCGTALRCLSSSDFNYIADSCKVSGSFANASFSFAGLKWDQGNDGAIEYSGKARSRKTNAVQLQSWDVSGDAK